MPDKRLHEAYEKITMPVDLREEILHRYTAAKRARARLIASLSAAACLVLTVVTVIVTMQARPGIFQGGNRLGTKQIAVQTQSVSYTGGYSREVAVAADMRGTQSAISLQATYKQDVCMTVDGGMLLTETDGVWYFVGQSAVLKEGQTVFWCPEGRGADAPIQCIVEGADGTRLTTLVLTYDQAENTYYLQTKSEN